MNCVYSITVFLICIHFGLLSIGFNGNKIDTFYTSLKFDYFEKQSIHVNDTKTVDLKSKTTQDELCIQYNSIPFMYTFHDAMGINDKRVN